MSLSFASGCSPVGRLVSLLALALCAAGCIAETGDPGAIEAGDGASEATRPRGGYVVHPGQGAPRNVLAVPQARIIYLNRFGGTFYKATYDDSSTNQTIIPMGVNGSS